MKLLISIGVIYGIYVLIGAIVSLGVIPYCMYAHGWIWEKARKSMTRLEYVCTVILYCIISILAVWPIQLAAVLVDAIEFFFHKPSDDEKL